jgi:glucose/arabinose dehydrogenase
MTIRNLQPASPRLRFAWLVHVAGTASMLGLIAIAAWSLKGRGYLYAIKQGLGLVEPLPQRVVQQNLPTGGGVPRVDRSGRVYPPADPDLRFVQVPLPVTADVGYTCVAVGPDGRMWASSDDGRLFRFPIEADGTLGSPEIIDSLQRRHGGPRLLTGFCFDPDSPPDAPAIYAAHSDFAFQNAREWSGTLTRLGGAGLEEVEDLVVGLPRSVGDHATNQPSFGPDGALYIPQAGNTAYGDADETWGWRPERLLNASILRLDLALLPAALPLDVRTDGAGDFDPFTHGAALTIYASGVRLAYDLCWADDGRLYAPINGSSAGGNAPGGAGGTPPALKGIPVVEPDWLARIEKGGYYGHPNPRQGHFTLNGGNPTAAADLAEVLQYPVGTLPDEAWHAPIANLGEHQSADGIIQYRGNRATAGGRKLDGCLILCRFSLGGDLVAIRLTEDGGVESSLEGIEGFIGFSNPLDVTQDPRTGHLYVSDYGARQLVLVKAAS